MQDCNVEILMPSLSNITDTPAVDSIALEDIALAAAESGARQVSDVYVGETVFLLVIVRAPDNETAYLSRTVAALDDVSVIARPLADDPSTPLAAGAKDSVAAAAAGPPVAVPPNSPRAMLAGTPTPRATPAFGGDWAGEDAGVALPVLRESAWVSVADPGLGEGGGGTPGEATRGAEGGKKGGVKKLRTVVCKGMWVLVRSPPERGVKGPALTGRQRMCVSMREARGGAGGLVGSKVVAVHLPLVLSCRHVTAGDNRSRAFITISARNITSDAVLSIVPPYVHLASSTVVSLDHSTSGMSARTSARTGEASGKERGDESGEDEDEVVEPVVGLEDFFSFKREVGEDDFDGDEDDEPEFDGGGGNPERFGGDRGWADDVDGDLMGPMSVLNFARESSREVSDAVTDTNLDDFGVFIPSFGRRWRQAVSVGPREEFDFVYAITQKLSDGASLIQESGTSDVPSLLDDEVFETSVSVAWACQPRGVGENPMNVVARNASLAREMSSGAVLATGQRSNTAVRVLSVQWAPPSLIQDVVLSFAGAAVAKAGSRIDVTVTIGNQTKLKLNAATLYLENSDEGAAKGMSGPGRSGATAAAQACQPDSRGIAGGKVVAATSVPLSPTSVSSVGDGELQGQLVPLRTVINVGEIDAGASATVRVSCVALGRGCAALDEVLVADLAASPGVVPRLWRSDAPFKTFVIEEGESFCGELLEPAKRASNGSDEAAVMVADDLSVIEF